MYSAFCTPTDADEGPRTTATYGSLRLGEDDLVPLHACHRFAGGSRAVAAQLVSRSLTLEHGLFALPEGHRQHLAAPAVGEGEHTAVAVHLLERGYDPLGSDAA